MHVPEKLKEMTSNISDRYRNRNFPPREQDPSLENEEYTTEVLQLARLMKDETVFGKPNFNTYMKPLTPGDLTQEFGGVKTKPFKCIY